MPRPVAPRPVAPHPSFLAVVAALAVQGCAAAEALECGPGTTRAGSVCTPVCGAGTTFDGAACVPTGSGASGAGGAPTSGAGGATASVGGAGGASSSGAGATSSGGGATSLAELLPEATFEALFPHRGTPPCAGAFYTYEAFLAAAAAFPAFASTGSADARRRELAAFLANVSHETTGGWPAAPDGPYAWGLCWITEGAQVPPSQLADYCAPSPDWPCAPGKKYFGRGPIQLSWNYNYGQAGKALGLDLLGNPDLVAADPTVAFRTALWFWMTSQPPKPSCHDVMVGAWQPSSADLQAGRLAGFGMTINVINGGLECGQPTPPPVADRIGYYQHFADVLGVAPGPHLDCAGMQPY